MRSRTRTNLEVAGERRPVRVALLQERVAALDGLVGHVRQSRRLTGEQLLADESVVGEVERDHPEADETEVGERRRDAEQVERDRKLRSRLLGRRGPALFSGGAPGPSIH